MFKTWLNLKEEIKLLTEELHEVEGAIWLQAQESGNLNLTGSKTFDEGTFKCTITHGETYKIDQKKAALRPELFRVKYEHNKADYRDLVKSQKDFVDEALTITPSKPSFKIVRIE